VFKAELFSLGDVLMHDSSTKCGTVRAQARNNFSVWKVGSDLVAAQKKITLPSKQLRNPHKDYKDTRLELEPQRKWP
jgi:hypothetical protein